MLAAAVTNLKRLLVACGNRMVFIITPGPRYHTIPCCCSGDHCTHLRIPESGIKLMQDLARLHLFIARRLSSSPNCTVLPACDLLTGKVNAARRQRQLPGSAQNLQRDLLLKLTHGLGYQVVDIDARILPPTGGEFNYNADNWSKFPEEVCNLTDDGHHLGGCELQPYQHHELAIPV